LHVLIAFPSFTASNIRIAALTADGTPQGISTKDEEKITQPEAVAAYIFNAIQQKKKTLILGLEEKLAIVLNFFFPRWVQKEVFERMRKEPNSLLHY
jgi:short-subunit dehydrogenase